MAGPEARRAFLLPPRILDRHGESDRAPRGTTLQIAGWFGAISRGRSPARLAHRTVRRRIGRPREDDRGTKSTLDDHMGPAEKTAVRKADLLLRRLVRSVAKP